MRPSEAKYVGITHRDKLAPPFPGALYIYIYTERVREERREGREFDIIVYSTTPHYDAQVQPPKGNSRKANSTPRSNVQHVQEAITHACALASFPGRPIPIPDVMTCTREGSVDFQSD